MPFLRALILAACLMPALPAHADWRPTERIEHYAITGTTGLELYLSIGERGPSGSLGRAIATTEFELLWSRDYRPQPDGSCILVSARPWLTITYRLPRPSGTLPPETQARWNRFIAGVEAHERVHGAQILAMTRAIEQVSVGLRAESDPDCRIIRQVLIGHLGRISDQRVAESRAFDLDEFGDGGNMLRLIRALVEE